MRGLISELHYCRDMKYHVDAPLITIAFLDLRILDRLQEASSACVNLTYKFIE